MKYIKLFEEYVGNADIFLDQPKIDQQFGGEENYIRALKQYLDINGKNSVTKYV